MFEISKPFRLVYLHNVENGPKAEKAAEKQPTQAEKEEAKEVNRGIDEKIARIEDLIKQSPVSENGKEKIRAKYKGILAKRETELKKLDEDAHKARLEIRIRTLVDLNEFENKELKPTVAGVWAEERVARPVSAPSAPRSASTPKPAPTPKPASAKPTPSPAPSLARKPAENLTKPSSPEITPPSPEQMAQIMQQNFSELMGDKSWSLDAGLFDSPQYNANLKTVEIKYPGQNINQITFVYHMDSKTRELQFKGDMTPIVYSDHQQLLIDQWESINGKTYGTNEEQRYKMRKSDREAEKKELAKGKEIEEKIRQGQLDQITGKELDALKKALKEYTITESLSKTDVKMYANFDVNERLRTDPMKIDPEVVAEKIINPKIKIIATIQAQGYKKMGGKTVTVPKPHNGDIAYHEYTGLRVFINGADKLIKVT